MADALPDAEHKLEQDRLAGSASPLQLSVCAHSILPLNWCLLSPEQHLMVSNCETLLRARGLHVLVKRMERVGRQAGVDASSEHGEGRANLT